MSPLQAERLRQLLSLIPIERDLSSRHTTH
jgi:hypothetical protein